MEQHAYVLEAGVEEGVERAQAFVREQLSLEVRANPDVVTLRYGLLTAEDARRIAEIASQAPMNGEKKAIIIAAGRAYHEAQNALLKLFEEPPVGTYLFLVLPALGSLLPTLKSRVAILAAEQGKGSAVIPEAARDFLKMSPEKRSVLIKKLATGRDEEERREHRDEAVAIVNGIERALLEDGLEANAATLSDIQMLRSYLYDRSAPVRLILEHLSLVVPGGLV